MKFFITFADMKLSDTNSANNEFIKSIFDNHYKYLCRVAKFYVGGDDVAQDIVQDVIISFWNKINKGLEIKVASLAYIRGAVINHSLKYVRDNNIIMCDIEKEIIMDNSDYDFNDDKIKEELLDRLSHIVETLSPQCREVFEQIVIEHKSYKSVAERLNISINSVKTQHARAMKKIRKGDKLLYSLILLSNFHTTL